MRTIANPALKGMLPRQVALAQYSGLAPQFQGMEERVDTYPLFRDPSLGLALGRCLQELDASGRDYALRHASLIGTTLEFLKARQVYHLNCWTPPRVDKGQMAKRSKGGVGPLWAQTPHCPLEQGGLCSE